MSLARGIDSKVLFHMIREGNADRKVHMLREVTQDSPGGLIEQMSIFSSSFEGEGELTSDYGRESKIRA